MCVYGGYTKGYADYSTQLNGFFKQIFNAMNSDKRIKECRIDVYASTFSSWDIQFKVVIAQTESEEGAIDTSIEEQVRVGQEMSSPQEIQRLNRQPKDIYINNLSQVDILYTSGKNCGGNPVALGDHSSFKFGSITYNDQTGLKINGISNNPLESFCISLNSYISSFTDLKSFLTQKTNNIVKKITEGEKSISSFELVVNPSGMMGDWNVELKVYYMDGLTEVL